MPSTFIFFGVSGSGKGTQAELLNEYLGQQGQISLYVQTGNFFRSFMKDASYSASLVEKTLGRGELLPAFLPIWMWTQYLVENFTGKENLIFDGLSRRIEEAPMLHSALDFYKIKNRLVFLLDLPDAVARDRLLKRGRRDDTPEYIKERFGWYQQEVLPVLEYFERNSSYKFFRIDADRSVREIHDDIISKISRTNTPV